MSKLGQIVKSLKPSLPSPKDGHTKLKLQTKGILGDVAKKAVEASKQASSSSQLRMQAAMDKKEKATQVVSNVMKKQHETAKAIIGNMR